VSENERSYDYIEMHRFLLEHLQDFAVAADDYYKRLLPKFSFDYDMVRVRRDRSFTVDEEGLKKFIQAVALPAMWAGALALLDVAYGPQEPGQKPLEKLPGPLPSETNGHSQSL
jgi:hypothetical protein